MTKTKTSKKRATIFDLFKDEIVDYLKIGLNHVAITKLINQKLPTPVNQNSLYRYIKREGLAEATKK